MIGLLRRSSARISPLQRPYSNAVSKSIYVSDSLDPYFNLAYEDWLFRNKSPEDPLLFIYRDEPCVVIGRNQNPWKEVNLPALMGRGIPFIRRRSGGGTVFHDEGNTNFSIHLPRGAFDRGVTGRIVLKAVQSLDIGAELNERNDIMTLTPMHVSGSAYKIVNKRAYHHGTMLISTNLETLGNLLRTDKATMKTKGVPSVRSPVCNLQQHDINVTHEAFTSAVVQAFREEYSDTSPVQRAGTKDENEVIRKGITELQSWEWSYGQTPEFTYTIEKKFAWGHVEAEIRSKHAVILSCQIRGFDDLGKTFEGQRYGVENEATELTGDERLDDIRRWLLHVMVN